MKKYIGKEYDNLFCVDIVCHGVPSKKIWEAYLRWQEQKMHSKVASVDFRNKKDFGWHDHVETLCFENGKSTSSRVFKELFYGHGQYTKELWIDRRENSKSLAWSSVLLALNNIKEVGAVVDGPKALGDIRGVTYIYGMFYRFGLIDMPDKVNGKMKRAGRQM